MLETILIRAPIVQECSSTNGSLVPNTWREWVDENWEQVTVLNYPELSKEDIDQLIDSGLREFYLRPKQILKMIWATRTPEDLKRKLYGLMAFLPILRLR